MGHMCLCPDALSVQRVGSQGGEELDREKRGRGQRTRGWRDREVVWRNRKMTEEVKGGRQRT